MALDFVGGWVGGKNKGNRPKFHLNPVQLVSDVDLKFSFKLSSRLCVSGAAGVLAGYPLDTVKVKIQTSAPGTYRSTFDCLGQLVARDGAKSLYKGMSSPLVGVAGINAITFGVNAQVN